MAESRRKPEVGGVCEVIPVLTNKAGGIWYLPCIQLRNTDDVNTGGAEKRGELKDGIPCDIPNQDTTLQYLSL